MIARSESLRWLFMSPPDAKVPEHRNAALALARALRGAGWEVVGRGGGWYAERYVLARRGRPARARRGARAPRATRRARMTSTTLTRAGFLRAALGGGAAAAGGIALGARGGSTEAAPSRSMDAEILNAFLALEYAQEDFYRAALAADAIDRQLREYATAAADQEREHVAFLRRQLGGRAHARKPRRTSATPSARRSASAPPRSSSRRRRSRAYVGQGANLTTPMIAAIAPLVSVEARQAAWIRDLAGIVAGAAGRRPAAARRRPCSPTCARRG